MPPASHALPSFDRYEDLWRANCLGCHWHSGWFATRAEARRAHGEHFADEQAKAAKPARKKR